MSIASTIINQQNTSIDSMNTDELLDLFKVESGTLKEVINEMSTDAEIDEYGDEYGLDSFLSKWK